MRIGIVGHGADKFTDNGKLTAQSLIRNLLHSANVVVSGHSPMGGVDIWAEEIAREMGIETDIKAPRQQSWDGEYGYKARNIDIARCSDEVHVILIDKYPPGYRGRRFDHCYHCHKGDHVKSGGCWTGHRAEQMGKKAHFHILRNE